MANNPYPDPSNNPSEAMLTDANASMVENKQDNAQQVYDNATKKQDEYSVDAHFAAMKARAAQNQPKAAETTGKTVRLSPNPDAAPLKGVPQNPPQEPKKVQQPEPNPQPGRKTASVEVDWDEAGWSGVETDKGNVSPEKFLNQGGSLSTAKRDGHMLISHTPEGGTLVRHFDKGNAVYTDESGHTWFYHMDSDGHLGSHSYRHVTPSKDIYEFDDSGKQTSFTPRSSYELTFTSFDDHFGGSYKGLGTHPSAVFSNLGVSSGLAAKLASNHKASGTDYSGYSDSQLRQAIAKANAGQLGATDEENTAEASAVLREASRRYMGFGSVRDMNADPSRRDVIIYGEELLRRGYNGEYAPYLRAIVETAKRGGDMSQFRGWVGDNPFSLGQEAQIKKLIDADKKAGKKFTGDYIPYVNKAVNKDDYLAWSIINGGAKGMKLPDSLGSGASYGLDKYKEYDEQALNEKAKELANSPMYYLHTIVNSTIAGSIGKWFGRTLLGKDYSLDEELYNRSQRYVGNMKQITAAGLGMAAAAGEFYGAGKLAGVTTRALMGADAMEFAVGRLVSQGLTFGYYNVATQAASDLAHGTFSGVGSYITTFAEGTGTGMLLGWVGSKTAPGIWKSGTRAARMGNELYRFLAEGGTFSGIDLIKQGYAGELKDWGDIAEAIYHSYGSLLVMKGATGSHGLKNMSAKPESIAAVERLQYKDLADAIKENNDRIARGETPLKLTGKAAEQYRQLYGEMEKGGRLSWAELSDISKVFGCYVIPPRATRTAVVARNGKYYAQVLDSRGNVIKETRGLSERKAADKERAFQRSIDEAAEQLNCADFNFARTTNIVRRAAESLVDLMGNGEPAFLEDGTPNPKYKAVTADDIYSFYNEAKGKKYEERTERERQVVKEFEAKAKELDESMVSMQSIIQGVLETYGVSEKAFYDELNKAPNKRSKNSPASQAVSAFNSAMSMGFEALKGERTGEVRLKDGRTVEIVNKIELDDNGAPRNPREHVVYRDEDGSLVMASASDVQAISYDGPTEAQQKADLSLKNSERDRDAARQAAKDVYSGMSAEELIDEYDKLVKALASESGEGTLDKELYADILLILEDAMGDKGIKVTQDDKVAEKRPGEAVETVKAAEKAKTAREKAEIVVYNKEVNGEMSEADRESNIQYYIEHPLELEEALKTSMESGGKTEEGSAVAEDTDASSDVTTTAPSGITAADLSLEKGGASESKSGDSKPIVETPLEETSSNVETSSTATSSTKTPDVVETKEKGASQRAKAEAYVDAYFPGLKGDAREARIQETLGSDFEQRVEYDKQDGVNKEKTDAYDAAISKMEEDMKAENTPAEDKIPPADNVPPSDEKPFHSYTLKSGKKIEWRTQTEDKDGVKVTRVVATADGKEVRVPAARFPMPKEYEIDKNSMPENFDGKVEGIKELRESGENAAATIIVSNRDGSIDEYEVRLFKKGDAPKPENEMKPAEVPEAKKPGERNEERSDNRQGEKNPETKEVKPKESQGGEKSETGKVPTTKEPKREEPVKEPSKEEKIKKVLEAIEGDEEDRAFYESEEGAEQLEKDYKEFVAPKEQRKTEGAKTEEKPEAPKEDKPKYTGNMPMKEEKGRQIPDYEKATARQVHDYIYNEKGYSKKVADGMVKNEMEDADELVKEKSRAVKAAEKKVAEAEALENKVRLTTRTADEWEAEERNIESKRKAAREELDKANKELDAAIANQVKWENVDRIRRGKEEKEPKYSKEEPREEDKPKTEPKQEAAPAASAPQATERKRPAGLDSSARTHLESAAGKDFADFVDNTAKSLGIHVVAEDFPNKAYGYTEDGVIHINKNAPAKKTVRWTFGHEATHGIKEQLGKGKEGVYNDFRDAVLDWLESKNGEGWLEKALEKKEKIYKNLIEGLDEAAKRDYLLEEVVCDAIGDLLDNPEMAEELFQRPSIKQKAIDYLRYLREMLNKMVASLKGDESAKEASEERKKLIALRDKFNKMYDEARQDRTVEQGKRYSLDTTAQQYGMRYEKAPDGTTKFYEDLGRDENGNPILGKEIKVFEKRHIENSPVGAVLKQGLKDGVITQEQYDRTIENQRTLMQYFKDTPDLDMFFAVSGAIGYDQMPTRGNEKALRDYYKVDTQGNVAFVPYKSNSETQYGTSFDVTTICRKTQTLIDVMSETMKKLGHGLTPEEVIKIVYDNVYKEGKGKNKDGGDIMVPCNVCYVFNRWVNLGNLFDTMRTLRDQYEGMSVEEISKDRERNIDKLCKHYQVTGNKALYKTYSSYIKERDWYNSLSDKEKKSPEGKEVKKRLDAFTGKNSALRKAMEDRIKVVDARIDEINFKIFNYEHSEGKKIAPKPKASELRELKELVSEKAYLDKGTWFDYVRLSKDYKPIPDEVLFDINKSHEFKENYPGAWKFRTTRGSALGKAASAYSPEYFGSGIVGAAKGPEAAASMRENIFLAKEKGEDGAWHYKYIDEDTWELKPEAVTVLRKAQDNAAAQNYLNGQRLQSTSDTRVEYLTDYNTYLLEQMMINSKAQGFTKVPECAKLFGDTGAMFNMSLIARGKGYEDLTDEQYEALSPEEKRDCAKIDGVWARALYSDISGINHGDAFALSDTYGNLQPIMVVMNNRHARLMQALANKGRVTFNIPYHASGDSEELYMSKVRTTGDDADLESREDYTEYQNDKVIDSNDKRAAVARSVFSKIKRGSDFSEEEMNYLRGLDKDHVIRQLYMRFRGEDVDGGPARIQNKYLLEKDRGEDGYGSFDSQCRIRDWDSATGEYLKDENGNYVTKQIKLTKDQADLIMTNDFWDRTLELGDPGPEGNQRTTADQNGDLFKELCKELGIRPRFSGWRKDRSKGWLYSEEHDLSSQPGYWSNLIDISMYDVNGKPLEQKAVDASTIGVPHFDKEQMVQLGDRRLTPMESNPSIDSDVMQNIIDKNVGDIQAKRERDKVEFANILKDWLSKKGKKAKLWSDDRIAGWIQSKWETDPSFVKEIAELAKLSPEEVAARYEDADRPTHAEEIAEEYADGRKYALDEDAFADDAEMAEAAKDYNNTLRMNERRADRKGEDFYPTPAPLALVAGRMLGARDGMDILDIGSGEGMLHKYIKNGNITAVEKSPELAERNRQNTGANVIEGDYLKMEDGKKYQRIVLNPPYGNKGSEAFKHVDKGYKALDDGGRMVAILPMGKNADRLYKDFVTKVESDGSRVTADIELPSCTFYKAGIHGSRTRMIVVDKGVAGETRRIDLSGIKTNQELYENLYKLDIDNGGDNNGGPGNGRKYALSEEEAERDREYAEAVESGDTEKAQRMLEEEADRKLNETLKLPDDSNEMGFKYHRGPAPKKTRTMYAVLNVSPEGLKAAYAGNKTTNPIGVWLDAVPLKSYPSDVAKNDDGSPSRYIPGDTGKSWNTIFSAETYAKMMEENPDITKSTKWLYERGGKHGTDVPNFGQMNVKDAANAGTPDEGKRTSLPHNKLIFEIECGMDENGDLTEYVKENGRFVKGKNQGLPWVGENKFYFFKTNPNASGNWGIAGTFRIKRLVPYEEVVSETQKANERIKAENERIEQENQGKPKNQQQSLIKEIPLQRWVGGYKPEDSGITVEGIDALYKEGQQKKLMEPTYDDNGNLIPLSQRFDVEKRDARYALDENGRDFAAERRELMRRKLRGEDVDAELEQLRQDRLAAVNGGSGNGGNGGGTPPQQPTRPQNPPQQPARPQNPPQPQQPPRPTPTPPSGGNPPRPPRGGNTPPPAGSGVTDPNLTPQDRAIARDQYEKTMRSSSFQMTEALQDSMLAIKKLMQFIVGKNSKRGFRIEEVPGYENPYEAENRMSSANNGQHQKYYAMYMKPIFAAISDIVNPNFFSSKPKARTELSDYMMAKHGLERNEKLAERDALEAARKGADYQTEYNNNREKDYSGLTALTGKDNVADAEAEARQMVADYESKHDTTELWNRVNAATEATLKKMLDSGLLSQERYDAIRQMFDNYIPLQGWDEKTNRDVYEFLTSKDGPLASPIRKAKGRSSKADDPIAVIWQMSDQAIQEGNRNEMKQTLLNFVLNHPSDAVSVSDLWLKHNEVDDTWEPVFAKLKVDDSPADVERKMSDFNQTMEQLSQQFPDRYKHGNDAINIPFKVVPGTIGEHQVMVKKDGRPYVLTINGNPRAAQAINGITNPDNPQGFIGSVANGIMKGIRGLSFLYTSGDLEFVASNWARDSIYTNSMAWVVKESPNYAARFSLEWGKMNPVYMRKLYHQWQHGTLDTNKKYQRYFDEFMTNGGETGFMSSKEIETYKRKMLADVRAAGSDVRKVLRVIGRQLEMANRAVENNARFAAYVTSREMGRSLERSIYDAKEVSVNFNKKGSSGRMFGAKGQTFWGNTAALTGGLGRTLFVFWNPAVQGVTNYGRGFRRTPVRAIVHAGALFGMGVAAGWLNKVLPWVNDEDEEEYYNLPEYVRRSNIIVPIGGKKFISVPLPQEMRAFYGLGELAMGVLSGNERYDAKELTYNIASQVSQIMPLDILEGGGGMHAFYPSLVKPIFEAANNESWTGAPISKEPTQWDEYKPDWTRAYKNTNPWILDATKWFNEWGGGDDYTQGEKFGISTNLNPAHIEYILKGYGGGLWTTVDKLIKMGETMWGDRDFDWSNMLVASRFVKQADDRTEMRKINNWYFRYLDEHDKTKQIVSDYNKAANSGDRETMEKYAERMAFMHDSDRYGRYLIFESHKKEMDELDDIRKGLKDGTLPESMQKEYERLDKDLKRRIVEDIHAYEDGRKKVVRPPVQEMLKPADLERKQRLMKQATTLQEVRDVSGFISTGTSYESKNNSVVKQLTSLGAKMQYTKQKNKKKYELGIDGSGWNLNGQNKAEKKRIYKENKDLLDRIARHNWRDREINRLLKEIDEHPEKKAELTQKIKQLILEDKRDEAEYRKNAARK